MPYPDRTGVVMRRRRRKGTAKTRRPKPMRSRNLKASATRRRSDSRPKQPGQQLRRELEEALEQQAATSEILKLISGSAGQLQPVFEAILDKATRICRAGFGILNLYDGDAFRTVALHNPPPEFAGHSGEVIKPHPESGLAQVARTRQIVHIDDIRTQRPYLEGNDAAVELADLAGARTLLLSPMLSDEKLIGAIAIYRQEVRPFTNRQIELVKNFASQAVIAIENARLLNELRQRTDDLSESLQQQTATADVLMVISSSPGDLRPVFRSVLENATRLCEAKFGTLYLHDGESFRFAADVGAPREYTEF
jgi:transcriptional regulator with GAF, ATPase, and Fis domain